MRELAGWLLLAASSAWAQNGVGIENTHAFTHPDLRMTIVAGETALPAEGYWYAVQPSPASGLRSVFLMPPEEKRTASRGTIGAAVDRRRAIERGAGIMDSLFWHVSRYARMHDGTGPATIDDLDERNAAVLREGPYDELRRTEAKKPYVFLIPNVEFVIDHPVLRVKPADAALLAVELCPYVDDGKHWVLYTDGRRERVAIDAELVEKYDLTITPVMTEKPDEPEVETYRYEIIALRAGPVASPVEIVLKDFLSEEQVACAWDCAAAPQDAPPEIMRRWAKARASVWRSLSQEGDAPILTAWLQRCARLYGINDSGGLPGAGRGGRTTNVFNVLGGRAAMQETLQMQALADRRRSASEGEESVAVETIRGVDVKSHPFEEMLKGRQGGSLPLADAVPPDRFFVYFARPAALLGCLERGNEFLGRLGSSATRSNMDYDLKARYTARLGVGEQWGRMFLNSGAVSEIAVFLPDLFLIDGTELTMMMRIPNMPLAQPLFPLIGVKGIEKGDVVRVPARNGGTAHWVVRGDLLLMSTHEQELEAALALLDAKGEGSLGRSAEFRYMLAQLPLRKSTTMYAYFSDPFIRRLVGPATKIGQLRRMRALADLQALTAGALLYRADGRTGTPTVKELADLGYVPRSVLDGDYSLRDDLVAVSGTYGTPADPASLLGHPVARATRDEADAYTRYVDEYNRFWRQFFDPIAMRLDDFGWDMELTTFILPLIDSQIYDQVREAVAGRESGTPLKVPELTPKPVLMLSLNLPREVWVEVFRDMTEGFLRRMLAVDPEIFDLLGPSVHLAVQDSDPIIALGGGDLMGAFAVDTMMMRNDMFAIPILVSVLTRPSKLLVETTEPQKVLQILRRASATIIAGQETRTSFRKIEGRDAWILKTEFLGMITLSFGIEVAGDYLVIANLPWSQRTRIEKVAQPALNGALLQADAGAVKVQMPALFASAADHEGEAAMRSIACLYPLVAGVSATPAEATRMHAALLGYAPMHPGAGEWLWKDGTLSSSVFGSPWRRTVPEYKTGDPDFGLFRGIEKTSVNMQLEDSGLRATLRWTLVPPKE